MSDGPAFFRAIEADPDDDTPRLVYADWLDENAASDAERARAEFVRVQCERDGPRAPLEARERQLLADYGPAWAAEWPLRLHEPVYRRGFLDPVALPAVQFAPHAVRLAELMPLYHVRLIRARDAMRAVGACPQLALVRRLTLAAAWVRNATMTDLASSPHLGNLQHLDLSHNQVGIRGATDLAAARLPALVSLRVVSNPIRDRGLLALAQADWPALEHLDAFGCGLRAAGVVGLSESPLVGRLASLQLSSNPDVSPEAWVRLARAPWERLQRLDLSNATVSDAVVEALADNPAVAGLRALHLGGATVTDRGARVILESLRLRNLKRLRLPTHTMHLDTLQRLRAAFGAGFNPPEGPARL